LTTTALSYIFKKVNMVEVNGKKEGERYLGKFSERALDFIGYEYRVQELEKKEKGLKMYDVFVHEDNI